MAAVSSEKASLCSRIFPNSTSERVLSAFLVWVHSDPLAVREQECIPETSVSEVPQERSCSFASLVPVAQVLCPQIQDITLSQTFNGLVLVVLVTSKQRCL